MKAFKDLVSITFSGADATEFMDAVGVMGDFFNGTRYLHYKLLQYPNLAIIGYT